jgi:putative ATP-dependent endonuclease of OLD family
MQDGDAASFPISQHGYGTRSWISFLTLSAFVETQNKRIKIDDKEAEQYVMLTMEEPEAHLHPQAQRQLFSQISKFSGQKVVSTHSPSIVSQSVLADAIYFSKHDGKTIAIRYKADSDNDNQDEKIAREVINTRAELLFASAIVLCEGITEDLALPIYFYEYFGCASYALGVSIINTGGKKNYKPYLSLIKNFNIPWFIFSDGEVETIKTVKSVVNSVFDVDYSTLPNVVLLDNGDEYETYLINEGYGNLIIEAVCEHEDDENYLDTYIEKNQGQMRKKKVAKKLNKAIVRDYSSANGRDDALIDLILEKKTDYALPVAKKIVAHPDEAKRIPTKVKILLSSLAAQIGADPVVTGEVTE